MLAFLERADEAAQKVRIRSQSSVQARRPNPTKAKACWKGSTTILIQPRNSDFCGLVKS